ncbi:TlpA family protein disulfide reductase [Stenotrophomonas sp. Betaine-02u-21]|uniref:TlpA family protein disulfide reductase n=1 Tax=unclassified Stenotrophomonas TaxID=196198 RepID=UPI000C3365C1|nr:MULTISPECIES: TlpA disulfide reductase family protein [unclassified Stenotrophomonas]PKH69906.1 TlpA family protein disulfide reductase [Stenotrophomonas sp. Betaine-02u-23]PKH74455.1 TlpA family protein disulfide reductase [Stenotrophomonas sp. Betaine-02u-21]PKH94513.1 TlpA family protein disulfide reductase [Stenotrophomonas sp. Bg11-02]
MKLRPALLWTAVLAGGLGLWAGQQLDTSSEEGSGSFSGAEKEPDPTSKAATAGIGDPLPPIVLPDLSGAPVDLQRFRGRPLLINVWASWCAPCVEEMPELAHFAAAQRDQGVQVLGLALDTAEGVQDFLRRVPVDYPIVLETPGPADASVRLGNTQGLLPYTVLVDAQGRIVRQKLGPFAKGEIEGWASGG